MIKNFFFWATCVTDWKTSSSLWQVITRLKIHHHITVDDFPLFLTSCKRLLDTFSDLYVRCVHYATKAPPVSYHSVFAFWVVAYGRFVCTCRFDTRWEYSHFCFWAAWEKTSFSWIILGINVSQKNYEAFLLTLATSYKLFCCGCCS